MQTAMPHISMTTSDGFESFLETRHEPDWLTQRRRDAFALYQSLCETELEPEEFRRIDLRLFRPDSYHLVSQQPETGEAKQFSTLMEHRGEFGGSIAHTDGHPVKSHLDPELLEQGIIFCDLSEAASKHEELVKEHLMTKAVLPNADRFSAWHAAFWTGGLFLYVPRHTSIEKPLHSLVGLATAKGADCSHTLIVLEEGADATLLEETASANEKDAGLHVGAVELIVASQARLRYVQLQNWNESVFHFAHQCGRIERDGSLQWTVGSLGSKFSHIHQDVMLDGQGADAQVNGVAFATGRQKLSYYTSQWHRAPNTHSDLLYKEVVRDRSRMIWRGIIDVAPEAQKTDSYQRNDSLILSNDARVDAIPGLKIEADDVRCTHGATAGQVDEEQILYCMSRGISQDEAMHMIVNGFFQQVFDRIPVEIVRDTLTQSVQTKLGFNN